MVITGLTRNQVALTGLVGSNPTASAKTKKRVLKPLQIKGLREIVKSKKRDLTRNYKSYISNAKDAPMKRRLDIKRSGRRFHSMSLN